MLFGNDLGFVFHQISAFLMCGKLKSAYLIAVKGDRVDAFVKSLTWQRRRFRVKWWKYARSIWLNMRGKRRLLRRERHSKENMALTTKDDEQQNVWKGEIFA